MGDASVRHVPRKRARPPNAAPVTPCPLVKVLEWGREIVDTPVGKWENTPAKRVGVGGLAWQAGRGAGRMAVVRTV
jgi:hypothetical protein